MELDQGTLETALQPIILEERIQFGEAEVSLSPIHLSAVIESISQGADRIDPEKMSQLDQAIAEVRDQYPELQSAAEVAFLAGNILWENYGLAAVCFEYAMQEEEIFFNLKARAARNFLLTANSYLLKIEPDEKAQRIDWLKGKRLSLAQAFAWTSHYKGEVSGHGLSPEDLQKAFDWGLELLKITQS